MCHCCREQQFLQRKLNGGKTCCCLSSSRLPDCLQVTGQWPEKETKNLIHSKCMHAKTVIWQGLYRVINGKQRSCQFNFIARMSKDWGCLNFPNIRMRGMREKILLGWQDQKNLSIIYPVKSHPFSSSLAPKIYLSLSDRVSYNAFPPNLYRQKITRLSCITWTNFSAHQPFTPWYQYSCSPYSSLYISLGTDKENLFSNQKPL